MNIYLPSPSFYASSLPTRIPQQMSSSSIPPVSPPGSAPDKAFMLSSDIDSAAIESHIARVTALAEHVKLHAEYSEDFALHYIMSMGGPHTNSVHVINQLETHYDYIRANDLVQDFVVTALAMESKIDVVQFIVDHLMGLMSDHLSSLIPRNYAPLFASQASLRNVLKSDDISQEEFAFFFLLAFEVDYKHHGSLVRAIDSGSLDESFGYLLRYRINTIQNVQIFYRKYFRLTEGMGL
ncbi:hypothetical protein TRVA0_036S01398 [Trichomonascus vanleenenianus]|uniref:uncharacterized protein n=1 Tax=Trichomonascus vanleenenianus TaxID=2268995 RepID=UPI003ECA54FC